MGLIESHVIGRRGVALEGWGCSQADAAAAASSSGDAGLDAQSAQDLTLYVQNLLTQMVRVGVGRKLPREWAGGGRNRWHVVV